MTIRERLNKYFREKSPFRITTDLLFYVLLLALLLPFSRKPLATGLNRLLMHRPAVLSASRQVSLTDDDYNWKLLDISGKPVNFSEFRGQVIFLNFWATWCPPCRAELPAIQHLYEEYGNRVAMILASQEDVSQLSGFMKEYGYSLPVYRLVQNPPEAFMTPSIPTTFVISRDGKITIRKTGSARWDGEFFKNYLESLLEEDRGKSGA
jgi:thiol-disulfide isomerase/thioredoxin